VIDSILTSVKKVLGLDASYTAFDEDLILHINSVFSTLNQLGIGPDDGFAIEDATDTWDDFLVGDLRKNSVKTYMYLKVRLLFDPPTTSFTQEAMKQQAQELEWRLNVVREGDEWVDPEAA
jgi:hypothetical protein